MNNETIRNHYDCYDRMKDFVHKHASIVGSRGAALSGEISAVALAMELKGVRKLAGATEYHGSTQSKRAAAELVREDMKDIRDTALAISEAEDLPDFKEEFRLPRDRSYALLLSAAKEFLQEATQHKPLFLEFEMAADFLENLTADIALLEQGHDDQHEGLSEKVGSTAELTSLTLDGMKIRKQLLPLMRNRFKADSGVLAEWETATYIVRAARTKPDAAPKPVA